MEELKLPSGDKVEEKPPVKKSEEKGNPKPKSRKKSPQPSQKYDAVEKRAEKIVESQKQLERTHYEGLSRGQQIAARLIERARAKKDV